MKKKYLVLPLVFVLGCIVLSSYKTGPAAHGFDCTGAETGLGNPTGCSTGGCHNSSSSITVTIELDSAGVATTHYKAGLSYTLKLTGVNTGTGNLPKFGYQIACIAGSAAIASPTPKGTWGTAPTGSHVSAPSAGNFVTSIVEHNGVINATTGTGTAGTTYVVSVPWTAPAAGTGTISFWAALNACNGNNNESGDQYNTNHSVISEWPGNVGMESLSSDLNFSVFPNPVSDKLNIHYANFDAAIISVFGINGNCLYQQEISGKHDISINTESWSPSIYFVVLQNGSERAVNRIVKQ